jgi:hypothetical protein
MTPKEGWYYENGTRFYAGEIPGVSSENHTLCVSGYDYIDEAKEPKIEGFDNAVATNEDGTEHILSIINGADLIENKSKAIQPDVILRIQEGDVVTWVNEDLVPHNMVRLL